MRRKFAGNFGIRMERITRIKALPISIFIILFQSTFCGAVWAFNKFAAEETIIIHKKQNGREITVKTGNSIRIELPEIGSAGYRWYIDHFNSQYLELISEETGEISEEGKIGAPVMHRWLFKAKKVGQTEIKMDYYRQWEGLEKSREHFFIKINIIKNGR